MVSCALSSLSLFTFLSHFTLIFYFTRIFHVCLSSALILMLAVTIATTFRVLPNKPGVTPSRSAAGLERTTTKDHNVCVCVCVCVCVRWRSRHQRRGKIQAMGRLERREPETISLSKCDNFHKTSQEHVCFYIFQSVCKAQYLCYVLTHNLFSSSCVVQLTCIKRAASLCVACNVSNKHTHKKDAGMQILLAMKRQLNVWLKYIAIL